MRSNILSKLIFASCVWYSDRAYYGLCVIGRRLPLQLQQCTRSYTKYIYVKLIGGGHRTRNTLDRSITHSLRRWVSTKSSISQLECIFISMICEKVLYPGTADVVKMSRWKIPGAVIPCRHLYGRRSRAFSYSRAFFYEPTMFIT